MPNKNPIYVVNYTMYPMIDKSSNLIFNSEKK